MDSEAEMYERELQVWRAKAKELQLQLSEVGKQRAKAVELLAGFQAERDAALRLYDELKRSIWKHLHIKHERTICPLSVGSRDRCAEIILRDAGLNPADGTPEVKRVVSSPNTCACLHDDTCDCDNCCGDDVDHDEEADDERPCSQCGSVNCTGTCVEEEIEKQDEKA